MDVDGVTLDISLAEISEAARVARDKVYELNERLRQSGALTGGPATVFGSFREASISKQPWGYWATIRGDQRSVNVKFLCSELGGQAAHIFQKRNIDDVTHQDVVAALREKYGRFDHYVKAPHYRKPDLPVSAMLVWGRGSSPLTEIELNSAALGLGSADFDPTFVGSGLYAYVSNSAAVSSTDVYIGLRIEDSERKFRQCEKIENEKSRAEAVKELEF